MHISPNIKETQEVASFSCMDTEDASTKAISAQDITVLLEI